MNIEIANRLVNLRKSNNLSQEALAEKLGISRQAVSKWERAEASPDTDNLILLARLYGVSLDELLKTEDEIPEPKPELKEEYTDTKSEAFGEDAGGSEEEEYVDVGFGGVHVKDKNGEVHVGWDGIHVDDRKKGENVHIDQKGVYVNGEKYEKDWIYRHAYFPMNLLITVAYLIIGCVFGAWHPGWLLFLLAPIWYSLVEAIEKKNARCFAYPVLAALIYLCMGFFWFLWHPGWIIFLTIPLYYSLIPYFGSLSRRWESGRETGEGTGKADEEQ